MKTEVNANLIGSKINELIKNLAKDYLVNIDFNTSNYNHHHFKVLITINLIFFVRM